MTLHSLLLPHHFCSVTIGVLCMRLMTSNMATGWQSAVHGTWLAVRFGLIIPIWRWQSLFTHLRAHQI